MKATPVIDATEVKDPLFDADVRTAKVLAARQLYVEGRGADDDSPALDGAVDGIAKELGFVVDPE